MGWTYTKSLLGSAASTAPSTRKTATRGRSKKTPATTSRSVPRVSATSTKTTTARSTTTNSTTSVTSNSTTPKLPNPANARLFSNSPTPSSRGSNSRESSVGSSAGKMKVRDMYENLLLPSKSRYHSGSSTTSTDSVPLVSLIKSRPQNNQDNASAQPKRRGRPPRNPIEQPARKRNLDDTVEGEQKTKHKKAVKRRSLPILDATYKLKLIVKGHTKINIPVREKDDLEDSKDIWCCEFEPVRHDDTMANHVAAIASSYSILFLDTEQGRFVKKYTHSEIQEVFYTMAWTTLKGKELLNEQATEDDPECNILAVAGRLGSIKLLNPLQNECYRYLFGHRKAVLALTFSKMEPRWLFSASADQTVRLWDIGSPTSKTDDSACLAKFNIPPRAGNPTSISISHDLSMLIVGCDSGDMLRYGITKEQLKAFRTKAQEFREKQAARNGDKWASGGAISTSSPITIYPAGDEWHEGYLDGIYILGQDGNESHRLYNKIVSRASDDMEIIIWDPKKSTKYDASIEKSLEWPESAGCTGVKYKVIEKEGQKVLFAGDYDGQIRIYNIGDGKKSKTLGDNSKEQFPPTRILSHPSSAELIRDVTYSSDTGTIIAVDNNNTIFVWAV
ncbi:MAG: WD40-repeat-containing domain protein [Benjaminiella poitrasii]|nr:MAG: WD40-repeat-containing domain protein [Benjaminiella poitrasii]